MSFWNDGQIHRNWIATYRQADRQIVDIAIFEHLAGRFKTAGGTQVLDAGCGSCNKSVILARQGLQVTGVDASEWVLAEGQRVVAEAGLETRISLRQDDLTRLSLASSSMDHAVACGVLMHIPDVAQALHELVRVLRPGGLLALSEISLRSPESRLDVWMRRLLRKKSPRMVATPWGLEFWSEHKSGQLCTRRLDVGFLLRQTPALGLRLIERRGILTEQYTRVRWPWLRRILLQLNRWWFKRGVCPQMGFGTVLLFKKEARP
ncbi:MAG: hypothetical protein AMXMBFR33_12530 [Candidatus Xenobia bacterium]